MGHVGKTVTQNVVSGSEITDGTVTGADLASDIAISTSGIITGTGGIKVDTIKNTSDVSMLTANAQGFLTQGKRLAFDVAKTDSQTIPTGGSHTVVQFNTAVINDQSAFTTGSNARFTVPTGGAGLYLFHTHFRYESSSTFTVGSFLYVNPIGSSESSVASTYNNNSYYTGLDIVHLRVCAVGDEVQMKVSQNQGAGQNIGTTDGGPTVRFMGYRIG